MQASAPGLALRAGACRDAARAAPCPVPRPGRLQCRPPKRAPAGAMLYRRIPESHHWQQCGPGRQFLHHGPHAPQPACHASYSRHPRAAPNPRRIRAQHTIQEEKKGRRNSREAHEILLLFAELRHRQPVDVQFVVHTHPPVVNSRPWRMRRASRPGARGSWPRPRAEALSQLNMAART